MTQQVKDAPTLPHFPLEPGIELDEWVATRLMGITGTRGNWHYPWHENPKAVRGNVPSYSTNMQDAMKVVSKIQERRYWIAMEHFHASGWIVTVSASNPIGVMHENLATAICIVALQVLS